MERKLEGLEGMTVEEMGMELLGRCIETYVIDEPGSLVIKPTLKIMGITYSVEVPKEEAVVKENIYDAWAQIIELFGASHLSGQAARIKNQGMEVTNVTPILN